MGQIHVHQIGKAYRQYPSSWSRLLEWLDPRGKAHHKIHWVLRGIEFTVQPGQAVALVGINGAGKSTLLKTIVGTLAPTEGSVTLSGRVAALLELGMGFDPNFTGRQNVMMAGQLLGLQAAHIEELMPQIEAFAEIGEYIDQPVRVYSSGMQVRLAFSVATAVRPDILIVDEALSVGDAYFQHKSFDRIRKFREQGTTLLLVSHDKSAILSICDRAILLKDGAIAKEGPPEEVMNFYNALIAEKESSTILQTTNEQGRIQTISGSGEARVEQICLLDDAGQPVELVNIGAIVTLCIQVKIYQTIARLVMGYIIKDRLGQDMYGTNTFYMEKAQDDLQVGEVLEYRFCFPVNLGPGNYSISTALHADHNHLSSNYEWRELALVFSVANLNKKEFVGCSWIEPTVNIVRP
jgi:lipopolysaccharide transport system ATP-binding protein